MNSLLRLLWRVFAPNTLRVAGWRWFPWGLIPIPG